MRRSFAWIVLAGAVLLPRALPAQPARSADQQLGRVHFEAGSAYFQAGRYTDAVREFARAFEVTGRVELLFNLGLAHERAGNPAEALRAYERFEAAGAPGTGRDELRARIASVRARLPAAEPPPAGLASPAAPLLPASSPSDHPSSGRWLRTVAWVSLGAGVLFVAGGAAALAGRASSAQDYNASFDRGLCLGADRDLASEPPACRSARDGVATWQALSVAGFVTGGALAVASLVLFLAAPRATPAPSAWACGHGPGELGVRCQVAF